MGKKDANRMKQHTDKSVWRDVNGKKAKIIATKQKAE